MIQFYKEIFIMRIRRRKHLEERLLKVQNYIIVTDKHYSNVNEALLNKAYLNFSEIFKNDNPIELEIGCGKGKFVTESAKKYNDKNYIAVEKLENIVLLAAEKSSEMQLKNVRFINSGAEYLPRYIKPNSIQNIYLNFSPPFPCKRDENKRLTNQRFIDNYKILLVKNGYIYLRTDDKGFFDYSFDLFKKNGFKVEELSDIIYNKQNYISTEYEDKFTALSMPIYRLSAQLI